MLNTQKHAPCSRYRRHVVGFCALFVWAIAWGGEQGSALAGEGDHFDDQADTASSATPPRFGPLPNSGFMVDRLEAREIYRGYINTGQYEQAVDAATLGLELTEALYGPNDLELVPYLNDLANALAGAERRIEANGMYARSISIVERQSGIFDPALVEALTGMGRNLQQQGAHEEAIHAFQRAQHVTHRSEGVYSLNQMPMLDAQVKSYLAQDLWDQAERVKSLGLLLYRRKFGVESLETIPAMYRLARWYHKIGDYRQARLIYLRSLKVQSEATDGDSLSMLPGLRAIAATHRDERGAELIRGLRASKRIVDIIEANLDAVAVEERIRAYLDLADWHVQMDYERDAWEYYNQAWALVSQQPSAGDRDWASYLSKPRMLYPGIIFPLEFIGFEKAGKEFHSDFLFAIGSNGRPKDVELVQTTLYGRARDGSMLRHAVQTAFRFARFRPAIVEGNATETSGHKLRRVHRTTPKPEYGWDRFDKLLEPSKRWEQFNPVLEPF